MHAPSLPPYLQLALWATPGADTWRGPSHDTLELLNPEGFSFKAPAREPEAREHRKRIIDASAFRRAIRPVPVLLFGVTTLRETTVSSEVLATQRSVTHSANANHSETRNV